MQPPLACQLLSATLSRSVPWFVSSPSSCCSVCWFSSPSSSSSRQAVRFLRSIVRSLSVRPPFESKMARFPVETSDQRAVLGVAISFAILPVIAVCLRLAARCIARKTFDTSDYCIIMACVSFSSCRRVVCLIGRIWIAKRSGRLTRLFAADFRSRSGRHQYHRCPACGYRLGPHDRCGHDIRP